MAGITLPPAGSGHTFHGGCFFRSQGEDRQGERGRERESCLNLLFSRETASAPLMDHGDLPRIGGGFKSSLCR